MSKSTLSKAPVVLIGLSLLAFTVSPIFAKDSIEAVTKPIPVNTATTSGISGRPFVQQKMENQKALLENRLESMREKIASKVAELKTRLQTFRDQRKANIAERVNTNLNNINQNQTTQMKNHLDKMSGILDKLEIRVNKAEPDIKDHVAARAAIAQARASISTASASVSDQALKDYTIQVTTEGRIGLDAKEQRNKLHTDLLAVRKLVIDAKQAMAYAIRVAKSGKAVPEIEPAKEGTNSGRE